MLRSKSSPRERPPSPGRRPSSADSHHGHSHSARASPRPSTPTRPPSVSQLNLSGTSFGRSLATGSEKCICGICTCGKHHCPVQQKTELFYDGEGATPFSTTKSDFKDHGFRSYQLGLMRPSPRHIYSPSNDRFDHSTTNQSTYTWHDTKSHRSPGMERSIRAPSPLLHSSLLSSPDARMDCTTSYGSSFVEHAIPQRSMRPASASYSYGSPRDLYTTNQLDFTGKQHPRCPATVLPSRPASARSGHVKYNIDLGGTWS